MRQQEALVMRLEIVEVRAAAVQLGADVVAGAMGKVLRVAGVADDGTGGIVCLPAGDRLPCREGLLDFGDGGIAGVANDSEDGLLLRGGLAIDNASPGDVIEGDVFAVGAGPDVDQQEVAGRGWRRSCLAPRSGFSPAPVSGPPRSG
jgi:hypothetical protein